MIKLYDHDNVDHGRIFGIKPDDDDDDEYNDDDSDINDDDDDNDDDGTKGCIRKYIPAGQIVLAVFPDNDERMHDLCPKQYSRKAIILSLSKNRFTLEIVSTVFS